MEGRGELDEACQMYKFFSSEKTANPGRGLPSCHKSQRRFTTAEILSFFLGEERQLSCILESMDRGACQLQFSQDAKEMNTTSVPFFPPRLGKGSAMGDPGSIPGGTIPLEKEMAASSNA